MKPVNGTVRQKEIRSFSILLLITVAVLFLLLSSLFHNNDVAAPQQVNESVVIPQSEKLVEYDEILHRQQDHLQQLDGQYALLLEKRAAVQSLDSLNVVIHQEEEYFKVALESISKNITVFTDESKMKQFIKMIASFKSFLTFRASISSLRNAVVYHREELNMDPDNLTQAESTDERNGRFSQSENSQEDLEEAKAAEKRRAEKLHARALKEKADLLEKRISSLASASNSLKQINRRLQNQQSETKALQKKAGILQEKMDALNAEIQLIRVDYNLLKTDAVASNSSPGQKK
jgi:chromosome segregation ATPase